MTRLQIDNTRAYWDSWLREPDRSWQKLDTYITALHQAIHDALALDDLEAYEKLWGAFEAGGPLCQEEPYASTYDRGLMIIVLMLAEQDALEGQYESVHERSERLLKFLEDIETLRERNNLPVRPYTEIKFRLFGALAGAKWRGPAYLRKRLLSPIQVITSLLTAAAYTRNFMDSLGTLDLRREMQLQALAMAEIDGCCLAARYERGALPACIDSFNRNHGEQLALELGHFRHNPPLDPESAHYWSFELAKLYIANEHTLDDIRFLGQQIRLTAPSTLRFSHPHSVARGWQVVEEELVSRIGRNFEVVEADRDGVEVEQGS
jgi:hypothetical protein